MKYQQMLLDFGRTVMRRVRQKPRRNSRLRNDPLLEDFANQLLKAAGCRKLQARVFWNPSLRTTAGMAYWSERMVVLNPKLVEISSVEVQRTLRHELAHLLAKHRVGRRRIEAHGPEWRQACHELPFKRQRQTRKFFYTCPACNAVLARVKPLRRKAACIKCCRKHNHGKYHENFRFRPAHSPDKIAA
jgi:predicted SprT family Zn-dependent metalloprotease